MKKFRTYILFNFFMAMSLISFCQVEIDKNIIMADTSNAKRIITGIGTPTDSLELLNAEEAQKGALIYGTASGINDLILNTPVPFNKYFEGMTISLKCLNANTDSVSININALGQVPIKLPGGLKLKADDIKAGQIVFVKYTGFFFQIINREDLTCPNGFVDVNDNYCIDINERAPKNFVNAMSDCQSVNAKLCTWGQWYYACQKAALGLVNMINNFEMVDDTSNHSHTVVAVGNTSCTVETANGGPASAIYYRCCFSK